MTEPPRIYTAQELSDVLQVNIRKVRENAKKGTWPSLDFGERTIRFTEHHLQTIITTSEKQPTAQTTRRRTRRTR